MRLIETLVGVRWGSGCVRSRLVGFGHAGRGLNWIAGSVWVVEPWKISFGNKRARGEVG